jgi:PAS domain S-box-containing protein
MTDQGEACLEEMYPFSRDHYRLAMEVANIGMWDWDLVQDKQNWTRECRGIFGLGEDDDVSYERALSMMPPEDRAEVDRLVTASLREHTEYSAEYRITWPDGSLHWIYARGRGIYNGEGEPVRMIGVAFDITARREAAEIQRRADKRVREVLESVEEAFAHLDEEWRFTYVNSRAAHIGRSIPEAEILGQKIWDLYPELLGTATERYFRHAMSTREPVAYEIYYPDIHCWYDIRAYPVEDGGLTIFLTDINERKFLEQERSRLLEQERAARIEAEAARRRSDELVTQLEHQQAFLHAIMNQAPSGLMIALAPEGNIVFYSEESARILGHDVIESDHYGEYVHYRGMHIDGTPYRAEEYPLTRALLKGEMIMQEDMLYRRDDGKLIHLSLNAAPIRDAQGNMLAAVVTFNDVSERFELERKKDEFINMASHELRTPLTSIKGNLQLARRRLQQLCQGAACEEEKEALEQVVQWNERALRQLNVESRLVNDLLDASRIQTENLRVTLEPSNLVQIVRDAVGDVQAGASTRSISLALPAEDAIPVMADAVRIGQVITNYLSNALKYSGDNDPVTIGLSLVEDEARVWVKDAGPGIAPEALSYIWDRFRQVGSFVDYTRLGGGGLGLGLYINHALVQLHGGRSGVESARGKGSTFWFSLPLAPQDRSLRARQN